MPGKCSHPDCPDPDNIGCTEGNMKISDCKYYNKGVAPESEISQIDDDYYRIPWTGNTLGINDLNFLTASSKPILIGITGVANAGKTTFLASLYCLLRHGNTIGDYSFSGSLTLIGWEDISWYLSWKDNSNIQFPPHTTSNSGRVPGLLHIAVKNTKGERKDLIFTDAPGEWFEHWRNNINSENSKGAKWIYEICDAFLLFADCELLSGSKRGQAKNQITTVLDRLYENIENRPIGLVWSKSDVVVSDTTRQQIQSHIEANPISHFHEFNTSVQEGENGVFHKNICDSIDWLLEKLEINKNVVPNIEVGSNDMFLSKRAVKQYQ